ncbi:sec-independent protein translocase protein TATB, chloroplastic isoform X1 [Camellia sinensis]|uniref:sec-independent protein translocase protein TATB, chloroplastic isoform X1 n=1 Tax=Camellia sinensis TaxID=4442 RepID=UPI001036539B|nr:sec-independent protein translocase protein TATB, chloroplastic isoform X1 [Camellia sinensis]
MYLLQMTATPMASAISTPTYLCSSSSSSSQSIKRHPTFCALSISVNSFPKTQNIRLPSWVPQLGLSPFSPWNGLRRLGISISQWPVKKERKRQHKGKVVYASLFGVGAPEALVIGVVALLVFGPKGLAEVEEPKLCALSFVQAMKGEWLFSTSQFTGLNVDSTWHRRLIYVARNLGKTLREFQPTIKELQEVSREFKSTLEREIGLDEIQNSKQTTYSPSNTMSTTSTPSSIAISEDSQTVVDPNGASSPSRAYSSDEYLKITEEQLKASAAQQQTETPPLGKSQVEVEPQTRPQDAVQEAASTIPPRQMPESKT